MSSKAVVLNQLLRQVYKTPFMPLTAQVGRTVGYRTAKNRENIKILTVYFFLFYSIDNNEISNILYLVLEGPYCPNC